MSQYQWRDCQEWRRQGLPLPTCSDRAAKLYDAALYQIFSFREEPSVGGIANTIKDMHEADPNFVQAHLLSTGLDVVACGTSLCSHPDLQESLDTMTSLCQQPGVTSKEKLLIQATCEWAAGHQSNAADIIDDVLVMYPTDPLVAIMGHGAYFYQGERRHLRDLWSRCLNAWTPDMPYYSYLHGQSAFGFMETNFLPEAEFHGHKALELNPGDGWAAHALAHVYETKGRTDEGLAFLTRTEQDWKGCARLSHHNYWHWALMHLQKGDHEAALSIFDTEIHGQTMSLRSLFPTLDYVSLLHRLQLEGVKVGERWEDIKEIIRPHLDTHGAVFYDYHFMMACVGSNDAELTANFKTSLDKYMSEASGDNHTKMKHFGADVVEAVEAFGDADYGRVVELLYPIRYEMYNTAGSNAQNDIQTLTLIHAALRSPNVKHHRYARHLLAERQAIQPGSPMTERLMAKALALHAD